MSDALTFLIFGYIAGNIIAIAFLVWMILK